MAISRDQPMRPALGDVLDAVDAQGEGMTALAALLPATDYDDEHTVSGAIADEATARQGLAALLPATDYDDEHTVSDAITSLSAWYRKGRETVTVAASSSETVTITYDEAFDAGSICMTTHALDETSASDTDVTVTLDSSDETGLEFTVSNASADTPKTVTIGYFTIGV